MFLWIVGLLILIGGAAGVIRVAESRGRSGVFWGVTATVVALVAVWGGWVYLTDRAASGDQWAIAAAELLFFAPLVGPVAVGALVAALPHAAGRTGASHWPMTRMDADQGRCVLRLAETALVVESDGPPISIPYRLLTSVRPDGECLRVHWLDGDDEHSLLLMPVDGPRTREGRIRLLEAIARRANAPMTR